MIYTPLTNKALRLAYASHHGQTDKSGQPYIFHPPIIWRKQNIYLYTIYSFFPRAPVVF